MKSVFTWKGVVLALVLVAALAAGCAKKQTVKSDGTAGAPGASAAEPGAGAAGESNVQETPSAPPGGTMVAAKPAEAGVAVTEEKASMFDDVLFDFDKSDLREDGRKTCQTVAAYLKKNPRAKLLIEGHCDERGTAEYNLALGERRAVSVRNYLASLGISKGALSTVSFGKERPLDPGHDEGAWAKNRRAHFVLK